MVAIETHDLTKQYGTVLAVDDLSLSIPEGVVYGVCLARTVPAKRP